MSGGGGLSVDGRQYLSNFPIRSGSHPMIRCSDAGVIPTEITVGATKDKLDARLSFVILAKSLQRKQARVLSFGRSIKLLFFGLAIHHRVILSHHHILTRTTTKYPIQAPPRICRTTCLGVVAKNQLSPAPNVTDPLKRSRTTNAVS